MLFITFILAVTSASFSLTNAHIFGFWFGTKCAEAPVVEDFDVTKYIGKWYEIERIPMIFERGLECVTAEYDLFVDGLISVKNSGIKSNGQTSSVTGQAYVPNPSSEPNKFYVDFRNKDKIAEKKNHTNYQVWKTDYETYSLVYSCDVYAGFIKFEAAWILSREKKLDQNIIDELKNELKGNKVNADELVKVSQEC